MDGMRYVHRILPFELMLSLNCLRIFAYCYRSMPAHTYTHTPCDADGMTLAIGAGSVCNAFIVPHYLVLNAWFWPLKCTNLFVLAFGEWRDVRLLRPACISPSLCSNHDKISGKYVAHLLLVGENDKEMEDGCADAEICASAIPSRCIV